MPERSSTRHTISLAASLTASVAAIHWRVVAGGETFLARDTLGFGLPSREYLAAALRAGRVPEWCDAMGLGGPFAANPLHGVTYPLAWLVALAPMPYAADLLTVLHLAIAAFGAALLAGRLGASGRGAFVAGLVFATSGYVSSVVANGMASVVAWTPWVAWAADRLAATLDARAGDAPAGARLRAGGVLAAALAAQIAQGEPVSLVTSGLVALAVTAARARPLRRRVLGAVGALAGAVGFAVLLSAATVVPALLYLRTTERAGGITEAVALAWSLHPLRNLEWIWPGMLGDRIHPRGNLAWTLADASSGVLTEPSWSMSLFVGVPVLLLALAAARRSPHARVLAALSLAFLVLALGSFTPVYPALREVVPLLAVGRFPEKLVVGCVLLWSALAGVGFTEVVERGPTRGERVAAVVAAVAALAGLGWLAAERARLLAHAARLALEAGRMLDPAAAGGIAVTGAVLAAASAAVFAAAVLARARPLLAAVAVPAAAAALFLPYPWNVRAVAPTASREVATGTPALLEPVVAATTGAVSGPRPRVFISPWLGMDFDGPAALALASRETMPGNAVARFGLAVLPGADSARSPVMAQLLGLERALPAERLAELFAAPRLVVPLRQAGSLPVLRGDPRLGAALVEAPPEALPPRAFVASGWRWVDERRAVQELVFPGAPRASRPWVNLVADPAGSAGAPPDRAPVEPLRPCEVVQRRPEDLVLRCASDGGGWAVLLDETAPGWTAEVDGREVAIARADALFRAVPVEPGAHEVRFVYRTPGLRLGVAIAAAAWMALLAAAWRKGHARRARA